MTATHAKPSAAERPLLGRCPGCEHRNDCHPRRKPPSVNSLMRTESDRGGCYTPAGNFVEPDGHDKWGCPSWMLILRLV